MNPVLAYVLGFLTVPVGFALWYAYLQATRRTGSHWCEICGFETSGYALVTALAWAWHDKVLSRARLHRLGLTRWRLGHNRDPRTGVWIETPEIIYFEETPPTLPREGYWGYITPETRTVVSITPEEDKP